MSDTAATAVRVHAAGDLRVEPVDIGEPAQNEAVLRIEYGGVCGSDVHYWRDGAAGASVLKAPMILGHEIVGTVRTAAADGTGPAAGTPVAVHPAHSCGRCRWCLRGRPHLCPATRYLGSAAQWPHTDGGFVTRMNVDTTRLLVLPSGLDARRAALAEPASIAWHAVERALAVGSDITGADVLVVGGGPIGLLIAAVARRRGATTITVTDVRQRPLDVARQVGADAVPVADLAGHGADVVFESSGATAGLATALSVARRGGAVVAVGQVPQGLQQIPAWLVVTNELTVTGSLRMDVEMSAALDFLADPAAPVDPVISHVFAFDDALAAFDVAADADRSSKVLLCFGIPSA